MLKMTGSPAALTKDAITVGVFLSFWCSTYFFNVKEGNISFVVLVFNYFFNIKEVE